MFGFLNINKPSGMTSHDVVAILRKVTKIKQIGHTGTLDPFATGVLPICIGKATRLLEYLHNDKTYTAKIQFGKNTDTYDCTGQITESFNKKAEREELEKILPDFTGEIEQLPPIYSAVKINGKKLYEYARMGEQIEIKPRKVTIYGIKLSNFDYDNQIAEIEISCKSGTYIRSLAFDIGKKLGSGAYLKELKRIKSDRFDITKSLNIKDLTIEKIKTNIINPVYILDMPMIEIDNTELIRIKNGMQINKKASDGMLGLVYNNGLCAIGECCGNIINMKKVLL